MRGIQVDVSSPLPAQQQYFHAENALASMNEQEGKLISSENHHHCTPNDVVGGRMILLRTTTAVTFLHLSFSQRTISLQRS